MAHDVVDDATKPLQKTPQPLVRIQVADFSTVVD
jgi:hypothetical protein